MVYRSYSNSMVDLSLANCECHNQMVTWKRAPLLGPWNFPNPLGTHPSRLSILQLPGVYGYLRSWGKWWLRWSTGIGCTTDHNSAVTWRLDKSLKFCRWSAKVISSNIKICSTQSDCVCVCHSPNVQQIWRSVQICHQAAAVDGS